MNTSVGIHSLNKSNQVEANLQSKFKSKYYLELLLILGDEDRGAAERKAWPPTRPPVLAAEASWTDPNVKTPAARVTIASFASRFWFSLFINDPLIHITNQQPIESMNQKPKLTQKRNEMAKKLGDRTYLGSSAAGGSLEETTALEEWRRLSVRGGLRAEKGKAVARKLSCDEANDMVGRNGRK